MANAKTMRTQATERDRMKIKTSDRRLSCLVAAAMGILLALLSVSCSPVGRGEGAPREVTQETIVVCESADPYYGLAQKIAQAETLALVDEFAEALEYSPRYIILVAAPQNLSGERLLNIGRLFKSSDFHPGLGIITGSTVEAAERLWANRERVRGENSYLGGDFDPMQEVFKPTIRNLGNGAEIDLNKATLLDTLGRAGFFYWSRHVGQRTWYWNSESKDAEEEELVAAEIPPLDALVIYTPSCDSLRPWVQENIAMGFIDRGAAAYAGNANSPFHTSALLRRGAAVPGPSSWRDFSLGLVAQMENQVGAKAYFRVPQFFMLGDPRIYLSQEQPYRVLADSLVKPGKRVVEGESDMEGYLAVRIEDGAPYGFLAVKGVTSASEGDPFYNSKLQMMDLGADKYVMFLHEGGLFRIELSSKPPLWWGLDALLDALDYSWVVMWLDYRVINMTFWAWFSVALFAAILLWQVLRRKKTLGSYRRIFLAALIFALVRLAFFLLRWDTYTVSADLISPTAYQLALGSLGLFANVAGGLMVMKEAAKPMGKALGLVFVLLPQFVLTGFYLIWITLMNLVGQAVVRMTLPWLWKYYVVWLPSVVLFLEILLLLVLYRPLISDGRERWYGENPGK